MATGPRRHPPETGRPSHLAGGVWAVTLWTAARRPALVATNAGAAGLSPIGAIVPLEWCALAIRFPEVTTDAIAVLPDRVRLLLHLGPVPPSRAERLIGWLKARVSRAARQAGLLRGALWEPGFDGWPLNGADELALWRRQIQAGPRAFGRPNDSARPRRYAVESASRKGTSICIPSFAITTSPKVAAASASSSGASRE